MSCFGSGKSALSAASVCAEFAAQANDPMRHIPESERESTILRQDKDPFVEAAVSALKDMENKDSPPVSVSVFVALHCLVAVTVQSVDCLKILTRLLYVMLPLVKEMRDDRSRVEMDKQKTRTANLWRQSRSDEEIADAIAARAGLYTGELRSKTA